MATGGSPAALRRPNVLPAGQPRAPTHLNCRSPLARGSPSSISLGHAARALLVKGSQAIQSRGGGPSPHAKGFISIGEIKRMEEFVSFGKAKPRP